MGGGRIVALAWHIFVGASSWPWWMVNEGPRPKPFGGHANSIRGRRRGKRGDGFLCFFFVPLVTSNVDQRLMERVARALLHMCGQRGT